MLVRRNPKKYPEVGPKWDIVGGRIDAGSPLFENLRREIKEEVNLDYQGEPRLVAAQDILRVEGRHVVRLTYTGELSGEPVLDDDHLEVRWFEAQEIKNLSEEELDIYFKELVDKRIIKLI